MLTCFLLVSPFAAYHNLLVTHNLQFTNLHSKIFTPATCGSRNLRVPQLADPATCGSRNLRIPQLADPATCESRNLRIPQPADPATCGSCNLRVPQLADPATCKSSLNLHFCKLQVTYGFRVSCNLQIMNTYCFLSYFFICSLLQLAGHSQFAIYKSSLQNLHSRNLRVPQLADPATCGSRNFPQLASCTTCRSYNLQGPVTCKSSLWQIFTPNLHFCKSSLLPSFSLLHQDLAFFFFFFFFWWGHIFPCVSMYSL